MTALIGPFHREDEVFRARLEEPYSLLIVRLMREILIVLDEPGELGSFVSAATHMETARDAPQERALGLLLPAMSLDPDDASGLRALTEDFLRAEKSARLRKVLSQIERSAEHHFGFVEVEEAQVWEWLGALNDVRLGLGGELGLETDEDVATIEELARAAPNGTREQSAAAIYALVTWWQDSLLRALKS